MLASAESLDIGRVLIDLLLLLAVGRLVGELCEAVRVPAVIGEIVAGIVLGPSALGLVDPLGNASTASALALLGELGVILLLLQVGLEMDLAELGRVGRASLSVAVIGVIVPFAAGGLVSAAFGHDRNTAVFVGAALTATSVGITARVLGDLGALAMTESRIVLGAAVADDVLGLVILTVVVKMVSGGAVGAVDTLGTLGLALGFLLVIGAFCLRAIPRLLDWANRFARSGSTVSLVGLAVTLGLAALANEAKLAFIIGAFMAGLAISRSDHHRRVAADLGALGSILIPVFFASIGVNADLGAMLRPSVLGLAAALVVAAVVGKLVAAAGAAGTRTDRLLIGIGMVPRGEVGLIFASIGRQQGVLSADLYGALLLVVLVTTVAAPPMLRLRLRRHRNEGAAPDESLVPAALGVAAAIVRGVRPDDETLAWFADRRHAEVRWSPDNTIGLSALLRRSDQKAWRFLDATGVLARALPEFADALDRDRRDIHQLDPGAVISLPTLERLDPSADDDLRLVAFAIDLCADRPVASLLDRLVPERAAALAATADDALLLAAATHHTERFEDRQLRRIATHFGRTDRLDRAATLASATFETDDVHRVLLSDIVERVAAEADGADLVGLPSARRRDVGKLIANAAVLERVEHAPTDLLLDADADTLARVARLMEPRPRPGSVRIAVTPDEYGHGFHVEIAIAAHRHALRCIAAAVREAGHDVRTADVATWPDGATLVTLHIPSTERPRARALCERIEECLRRPPRLAAVEGLTISFDQLASPAYTIAVVTGVDSPGVLETVFATFAAARIDVHSASVRTIDGQVDDRFELSDRGGQKLASAQTARLRASFG